MGDEKTAKLAAGVRELLRVSPVISKLGQLFQENGFELALVGGPVRDALLGRLGNDLDFTTDATPEQITKTISGYVDATWDIGARFGTIGASKDDLKLEITTYRAEAYEASSRKPEVVYGKSLADDLGRRDFSINAMAVKLPELEFVDLYDGLTALENKTIRTPSTAESSFNDDPLRMLRAARFASQLNFAVAPEIVVAMKDMKERINIVSKERVRDEIDKLILADKPRLGLTLLIETGLMDLIMPEVPAMQLEADEHLKHKNMIFAKKMWRAIGRMLTTLKRLKMAKLLSVKLSMKCRLRHKFLF